MMNQRHKVWRVPSPARQTRKKKTMTFNELVAQVSAPLSVIMGALLSATAKARKLRETIWIFAAGSTLAVLVQPALVHRFDQRLAVVFTFVISLSGGFLIQGLISYTSENKGWLARYAIGRAVGDSSTLPPATDDEQKKGGTA